ncbi:MAG: PSP1 domain-containing protein [Propionibacteriaceae bacterium]
MMKTAAVEFEPRGRLFHVDAGDFELHVGDKVMFPTELGPELATVVWPPTETSVHDLPRIVRLATDTDIERDDRMRADRARCLLVARELVALRDLPMSMVAVDIDDRDPEVGRSVAFYFTAPGRVDFRALVPELARAVSARIDLRQIAGREEAKLLGGVGHCGRELCCTTWLETFETIPLRLAKLQDMGANPLNIQGACGKLLCCIAYEAEHYAEFARTAPGVREQVVTPEGEGTVVGLSLQLNAVHVRLPGGNVTTCNVGEVCQKRATARQSIPRPPVSTSSIEE